MKECRYLAVLFAIAYVCVAGQAMGETCEGDKLTIPDSKTLASVQALANAGDAHAQAQMGGAYFRGQGVEHDAAKALSWLEKSAAGGSSEGQYLLGQTLAINAKSGSDFLKAAGWFKKSADQGCLPALLYLGLYTQRGNGVPKNAEAGIVMVTKAAEAGYAQAQYILGTIMITGDEGVAKAPRAGFNWIKRAADAGDSVAQISLATLYLEGTGTDKNPKEGIAQLQAVISKGDEQSPTAAYSLGWYYMEGKGVSVDNVRALELMLIAANSHISDSEARVKKITNELPKQKLATSCSVYMDPQFATNGAKEYIHASSGETVVLMRLYSRSAEVYFPERPLAGFISRACLASGL